METKFYHEKSFNLKKLAIVATNGNAIDITKSMIQLDIHEDIYSSTMSGSVTLSDSLDLLSNTPVLGFEMLSLTFGKPGTQKEVNKLFRIYKVDNVDINYSNQSNQTYTIRFCSPEQILSMSLQVSKSYRGKKINEIVSDILRNTLNVSDNRIDKIEDSKFTHDIIVPYLYPFEAIQWLTMRTVPPFLFYESVDGYSLQSIQSLFKQPSKVTYRFTPKNIAEQRDSGETRFGMNNVTSYEYMDTFDIMEAVSSGMFSGQLRTIDVITQKVNTEVFDYLEEFKKRSHVEKKGIPFVTDSSDHNDKKMAFSRFVPVSSSNRRPSMVEQWMLQRASQMEQLNYLKLKLVVPGDVSISIGDMIDFGVPSLAHKRTGENNLHPLHAGRFLITGIKHQITPSNYVSIIEAVKDCINAS